MSISRGAARRSRPLLTVIVGLAIAQPAAALVESPAGTLVAETGDGAITFRILDDDGDLIFDVEVSGAATGNGIYLDIEVIDCTAANSPGSIFVDVPADTTTIVTSPNTGTLTRPERPPLDFSGIGNLAGGTGSDTFILDADLTGLVNGGPGADSIVGAASPNAFVVSATDSGTVNTTLFANVEDLSGGAGADTFTLTAPLSGTAAGGAGDDVFELGSAGSAGSLAGGAGLDTLNGPSSATTFAINAADAGNVNGLNFTGIENLGGGPAADLFIFSASLSGTAQGGAGNDTFAVDNGGSAGAFDGGAGSDTLTYGGSTGPISVSTITLVNIETLVGSANAADLLLGTAAADTFTVTGANSGTVNGLAFADFENLDGDAGGDTFTLTAMLGGIAEGGADDDTFNLEVGGGAGAFDGGAGSDTLQGPPSANNFNVNAADAGSINGVAFTNIENLAGGPAADQFTFSAALSGTAEGSAGDDTAAINDGGSAGAFDGGAGVDTLSYAGSTGSVSLVTSTLTNVEVLIGSTSANDLLIGTDAGDAFVVSGVNAGTVNGLDFSAFENLDGGAGADTFTLAAALTGSAGGGAGDDLFDLGSGGSASSFDGGADFDTLVGSMAANTFVVSGTDAGTVNGTPFMSIENLIGGAAADTFTLDAALSGSAQGGGGDDVFEVAPSLPVAIDGGAGNDLVVLNGPTANGLGLSNIEDVTFIPAQVVFVVRGTVNSVAPDLESAFTVGDEFELRYTFEARAADSQPSADVGQYDAVTRTEVIIGAYSATLPASGIRRITVQDNLNGIDRYRVDLSGVGGPAAAGLPLQADQFPLLLLTDFGGVALSDDSLPVAALDVGDFGQNDFLALRFTRPDTSTALVVASVDSFEAVPAFRDVPATYWAARFISKLGESRITGGCGLANYCPEDRVTRAQMAVFLERGIRGGDFVPPAASGTVFLDVGAQDFAAAFIEQLASDGITGGCGGGNFCPNNNVTRAQMAVFLLRARYGSGYLPPPAQGVFPDVPLSYWAAAWIEQLFAEGITSGCGGGNFCPDAATTRAQMAVFLVRTFDL